jgi:hypothetical protein
MKKEEKLARALVEHLSQASLRHGSAHRGTLRTDEFDVTVEVTVTRRVPYDEVTQHRDAAIAQLREWGTPKQCDCYKARPSPHSVSRYTARCSQMARSVIVFRSYLRSEPVRYKFVCGMHAKNNEFAPADVIAVIRIPTLTLGNIKRSYARSESERRVREHHTELAARAITAWWGSYRATDELAARRAGRRP